MSTHTTSPGGCLPEANSRLIAAIAKIPASSPLFLYSLFFLYCTNGIVPIKDFHSPLSVLSCSVVLFLGAFCIRFCAFDTTPYNALIANSRFDVFFLFAESTVSIISNTAVICKSTSLSPSRGNQCLEPRAHSVSTR